MKPVSTVPTLAITPILPQPPHRARHVCRLRIQRRRWEAHLVIVLCGEHRRDGRVRAPRRTVPQLPVRRAARATGPRAGLLLPLAEAERDEKAPKAGRKDREHDEEVHMHEAQHGGGEHGGQRAEDVALQTECEEHRQRGGKRAPPAAVQAGSQDRRPGQLHALRVFSACVSVHHAAGACRSVALLLVGATCEMLVAQILATVSNQSVFKTRQMSLRWTQCLDALAQRGAFRWYCILAHTMHF